MHNAARQSDLDGRHILRHCLIKGPPCSCHSAFVATPVLPPSHLGRRAAIWVRRAVTEPGRGRGRGGTRRYVTCAGEPWSSGRSPRCRRASAARCGRAGPPGAEQLCQCRGGRRRRLATCLGLPAASQAPQCDCLCATAPLLAMRHVAD
jgi:hypothetical protein